MTALINPLIRSILGSISANPVTRQPLRELARRGLLPQGVRKSPPAEWPFWVHLRQGASFRYRSSRGDNIGGNLYWGGAHGFENETLRVFVRPAKNARHFPDIGANTDVFSLVASALSAEAVSDRNEIAKFHVPSTLLPSSASLRREGFRGYERHLVDVPVITMDSLCSGGRDVDLVKLDVEGFEDEALEGMRGVLGRCRPDLTVECDFDGPYQAVEEILRAHGYRLYHLRKEGPLPLEHIRPEPSGVFRNSLCTTRRDLGEAALAAHRGGGTLTRVPAFRAVQNGTSNMAKCIRALERCYDGELT